jgi:hypothetical protein
MENSIRVSTIASLFAGLAIGVTAGIFSAAYIAKNWPISNYVEVDRFAAPSPMIFGQTKTGQVALCDRNRNAWRLQSYEPEGADMLAPAWRGVQDLTPIYRYQPHEIVGDMDSRPDDPHDASSSSHEDSSAEVIQPAVLVRSEWEKCV